MEDEPWDELMGPSTSDLKRMLRQDSAPASMMSSSSSTPPLRRSPASVAAPPSTMFNRLPDRWAQLEKEEEAQGRLTGTEYHNNVKNVEDEEPVVLSSTARTGTPQTQHRSLSEPWSPPPINHHRPMAQRNSYDETSPEIGTSTAATLETPPRRTKLFMEDEDMALDSEDEDLNDNSLSKSPELIRQEALRMLEVVDASENRHYSVHRTITGGFMASHRTLGTTDTGSKQTKRIPTALAAFHQYTANRTKSSNNDRDPFLGSKSGKHRDFNENNDDNEPDGIMLDVATLENRSAYARPATESTSGVSTSSSAASRNWSSRYSIDHTLLAMAGGGNRSNSTSKATKAAIHNTIHSTSSSSSNKRLLDRLDKENELDRHAARNLFQGGSMFEKTPQIFGNSGSYAFRKNNVFGKQNVVVSQPNLRSVSMDEELPGSSLPPVNSRIKSWQEQLQQKRIQQRLYMAAILILAIALTVALTIVYERDSGSAAANSGRTNTNTLAPGSVTFYVTANGPFANQDEKKLIQDFQGFSPQASFMVHLGNIQDASTTLCSSNRYGQMADVLLHSPVPTFVLPGPQDWTNCPSSTRAWHQWDDTFRFYNKKFVSNIAVQNQVDRLENFAFVTSGVLFVGVHVINGQTMNTTEVVTRNDHNLGWVTGMCNQYANDVRAVVVLGNAKPGLPQNKDFFDGLSQFMKNQFRKPLAYVHASPAGDRTGAYGLSDNLDEYQLFDSIRSSFAIQIDSANGLNAPVRLIVGYGDRPFIVG